MTLIAAFGGLVMAFFGGVAAVSPLGLVSMATGFASQRAIYAIAAVRVVIGVAFFVVAPSSRAPGFLHVLGVLVVIAGLITPFFSVQQFERVLSWWSQQPPPLARAWGAGAMALGLFVLWAVVA